MNTATASASALEIANEFIKRAYLHTRDLTPMQVQKLVYFAHGMSLATLKKPLISELFEAWKFGPVVRDLYDALRQYGGSPIRRPIYYGDSSPFNSEEEAKPALADLSPPEFKLIERIDSRFGSLPAFKLSALTHEPGSPWANVYRDGRGQNDSIPNEALGRYFAQLAAPEVEAAIGTNG